MNLIELLLFVSDLISCSKIQPAALWNNSTAGTLYYNMRASEQDLRAKPNIHPEVGCIQLAVFLFENNYLSWRGRGATLQRRLEPTGASQPGDIGFR